MTFNLRSFLPLALAAVATVGVAHADTFTGTVYNLPGDGTVVSPSTLGTAVGTFTVGSFNFNAQGTAASPYTIGGFLSGGSNLVIAPTLASQSLGSKEIVFNGSTNLVNGTTYTFNHDDGMLLFLDGSSSAVISAAAPTVAANSSFTFTGTSGVHTFTLEYGENSMAPADLIGPFTPAAVTPEPSSIMLLGTGLVGLAGAVRRRIKR